jgi:hypothetical protein
MQTAVVGRRFVQSLAPAFRRKAIDQSAFNARWLRIEFVFMAAKR